MKRGCFAKADYTKIGNKGGVHSSALDDFYLALKMININNHKMMTSEISKKQSTINLQEKYSAEKQKYISIWSGVVFGAPLFFPLSKMKLIQKIAFPEIQNVVDKGF